MADTTKIAWCDHTHNPWWGCARVSPACRSCYADALATRWGHELWRRHGDRRMLSDANWRKPLKWNADAAAAGVPARVFCASMADVFEDHPQVTEPRERLWPLIEATPWLHWQLLTKRPENVTAMAPWGYNWPANVWIGTSVENQRWADTRVPILLSIPAKVRFLSAEPLLGPIDLRPYLATGGIHQVIIGGESGPRARAMDLGWAVDLIGQCREAGAAPFFKQTGAVYAREHGFTNRKGETPAEWPAEVAVQEFPRAAEAVTV